MQMLLSVMYDLRQNRCGKKKSGEGYIIADNVDAVREQKL